MPKPPVVMSFINRFPSGPKLAADLRRDLLLNPNVALAGAERLRLTRSPGNGSVRYQVFAKVGATHRVIPPIEPHQARYVRATRRLARFG
jgi:hypothetical protein